MVQVISKQVHLYRKLRDIQRGEPFKCCQLPLWGKSERNAKAFRVKLTMLLVTKQYKKQYLAKQMKEANVKEWISFQSASRQSARRHPYTGGPIFFPNLLNITFNQSIFIKCFEHLLIQLKYLINIIQYKIVYLDVVI